MKNEKLDSYTFGDSQAAINLAGMLSTPQYKQDARKVSSTLCSFNEIITEMNGIKNLSVRVHLYTLVMEDAKRRVASMAMSEVIKSHMLNVMAKSYKLHTRICRTIIINNVKDMKKRDQEISAEQVRRDG